MIFSCPCIHGVREIKVISGRSPDGIDWTAVTFRGDGSDDLDPIEFSCFPVRSNDEQGVITLDLRGIDPERVKVLLPDEREASTPLLEACRKMADRCPVCNGTGSNRDAMQEWDIPEAPVPDCHHCAPARDAIDRAEGVAQ